ncbi:MULTISPECIES: hypothetical protein [Gilliamella]|uniref:hypothetical protein n=1 Tax=Gilliamella TaxID=1193503 RepID=UPI000D78B62F|nr:MULTISPECIES: hypothetical protein [Gilliamella]MBI0061710.1 hypothetical protein [Gilliamella sp. M0320]PXY93942.1 hypothetical protein DKK77_04875 [Gilliamella apis]WLS95579.1 hypothetical protein RAM03_07280 [Gilliamella apis]
MVLVLTVVVLQSTSFANYALTTKTTNIIYGSAPYLTFDGGRTQVTNTEALLRISLSDGRTFTPTTNDSSFFNPIVLPVAGQSSTDIGMLVPTDTNSIALSSLIGTPYNYWGDDDGDGQGVNGVTATGSLNLSIVDKFNNPVARNEVLTICKAPYRLTLSNGEGTLKTRYGVPNESRFSASNASYYIKPKTAPVICYAQPDSHYGNGIYAGPASIWNPDWGFLPQSVTPSSYGLNFPTTGANNLLFDLDIGGVSEALSWAPVSHSGITATMINSTRYHIHVTLTGPVAKDYQLRSDNPGEIARPSLPQVFELVGRDSNGNAVVKYGFELKQWFVNRGFYETTHSNMESWCNKIGYRLPKVSDLTNASCQGNNSEKCGDYANEIVGATPSAPNNSYMRHMGAGFFAEWGRVEYYLVTFFFGGDYWTQDRAGSSQEFFTVDSAYGWVGHADREYTNVRGLCVYP